MQFKGRQREREERKRSQKGDDEGIMARWRGRRTKNVGDRPRLMDEIETEGLKRERERTRVDPRKGTVEDKRRMRK